MSGSVSNAAGAGRPRPPVRAGGNAGAHLTPQVPQVRVHGRTLTAATRGQLTPAQLRIVELVAEGLTDQEVGEQLGWTRRTVAAEVQAARARLGARNRAHLAVLAIRHGLID